MCLSSQLKPSSIFSNQNIFDRKNMLDVIASVVTCVHPLVPAKGAANAETLAADHKSPAVESTGAIGALWEV